MNPFLAAASDPYLTDPHQYAARHRDDSNGAEALCLALDAVAMRQHQYPCMHHHARHSAYSRRAVAA